MKSHCFPPLVITVWHVYSLLPLFTCLCRCAHLRSSRKTENSLHFAANGYRFTRAPVSYTHPAPHNSTPQLTLWYDSSHCHGYIFLLVLERSTEMSKTTLFDPPPKKTSSLDLHHPERSNQADAISIDGVRTVCQHTHSIITSSNARASERGQCGRCTGLLSRVGLRKVWSVRRVHETKIEITRIQHRAMI
jgi:hypothetical protein